MTAIEKYDAITQWLTSCITEQQVRLCVEVAEDHFRVRAWEPELLERIYQRSAIKLQSLPAWDIGTK